MRTCVYTFLFGGYDQLLAQPVAADSDSDFICFTNDPSLRSDTWQTHVIDPRYPTDIVRSARYVKIIGDDRLAEYDTTLCIDASVRLRRTPEDIIREWLTEGSHMALAQHSYREQVIDEFDEVVRLNYDDRARVHEQLIAYSLNDAETLTARPLWTGMLVRRRTEEVERAMRLWFDHVLRYSRRDQLSVNVALATAGLAHDQLTIDNFDSEYHQWPVLENRRISQGKASSYASGPIVAEMRRAERRLDEVERQLQNAGIAGIEELGPTLAGMRDELARNAAEREHLYSRMQELQGYADRWHASQGVIGASANWARAVKSAILPAKK